MKDKVLFIGPIIRLINVLSILAHHGKKRTPCCHQQLTVGDVEPIVFFRFTINDDCLYAWDSNRGIGEIKVQLELTGECLYGNY